MGKIGGKLVNVVYGCPLTLCFVVFDLWLFYWLIFAGETCTQTPFRFGHLLLTWGLLKVQVRNWHGFYGFGRAHQFLRERDSWTHRFYLKISRNSIIWYYWMIKLANFHLFKSFEPINWISLSLSLRKVLLLFKVGLRKTCNPWYSTLFGSPIPLWKIWFDLVFSFYTICFSLSICYNYSIWNQSQSIFSA